MAEFEGTADITRQRRQEISEKRFIEFQRGRKLKQDWSQTPGGSQRVDGLEEDLGELGGFEPQNVSDPHVGLERKNKSRTRFIRPVFERRLGWQPAKGIVHFHRVEPAGVVIQKLFR